MTRGKTTNCELSNIAASSSHQIKGKIQKKKTKLAVNSMPKCREYLNLSIRVRCLSKPVEKQKDWKRQAYFY